MPLRSERLRTLKATDLRPGPVAYWMSRDQRAYDNWAPLFSQQMVWERHEGLAVVFCLALQTSDADIYAIGDAIQVKDGVTGQSTAIPLASPANRQGRIVADHIVARSVTYPGTYGTSSAKVFDLAVSATGLNRRQLERQGIALRGAVAHSSDYVGYYPGATQMAIKLLYSADDGR